MTGSQRYLLIATMLRIKREPKSYNQESFGQGILSCDSPACIAGHIVAADAASLAKVQELLPTCQSYTQKAQTIARLAETALKIPEMPKLFGARWRRDWFDKAEVTVPDARQHNEWLVPDTDDAIAVLTAILDGRIEDALTP